MKVYWTHLSDGKNDYGQQRVVEITDLRRGLEAYWEKMDWAAAGLDALMLSLGLVDKSEEKSGNGKIAKVDNCAPDLMHKKLNEIIEVLNSVLKEGKAT